MKKKHLIYVVLPAITLVLVGAGTTYAYGWLSADMSPEEMSEKHQEMFQGKADALGMSTDEIKDAWAQGKSMRDIAEEKGIEHEDLKAKMLEVKKAKMQERLQVLVDQGTISQDQMGQRLETMGERMKNREGKCDGEKRHQGKGRHFKSMGFEL